MTVMTSAADGTDVRTIPAEDFKAGCRYWRVRQGFEARWTVVSVEIAPAAHQVYRDGRWITPEFVTITRGDGNVRTFERGEQVVIQGPWYTHCAPFEAAGVAETKVNGRRIADYAPLGSFPGSYPGHIHTRDDIVGYVVRETVREGIQLHHGAPDERDIYQSCGYDVFAVDGATRYGDTFPVRDSYRQHDGYAVVDTLYVCGCRS